VTVELVQYVSRHNGGLLRCDGTDVFQESFYRLFQEMRSVHPAGYTTAWSDYRQAAERSTEPIRMTPTIDLAVTLGTAAEESDFVVVMVWCESLAALQECLRTSPPSPLPPAAGGETETTGHPGVALEGSAEQPLKATSAVLGTRLLVAPMESGLVMVHVVRHTKAASGPISSWALTNESLLADLLRLQVTNEFAEHTVVNDRFVPPHVARKRAIQRIAADRMGKLPSALAARRLFPCFAGGLVPTGAEEGEGRA
jgi:hypothetical protein